MHAEPLYRHIVSEALARTWHHKHTWVFGFFAAALGFGGAIEAVVRSFAAGSNTLVASLDPEAIYLTPFEWLQQAIAGAPYPILMMALALITGLCFGVAFLWMAGTSVAALIYTARGLDEGKDMHLNDGIKAGGRKAFPVIAISFIGKLAVALAIGLTFYLLGNVIHEPTTLGAILYGIAFVGMIIAALSILYITTYAILYNVLRKQNMIQAFSAGHRLLIRNWLLTIETSLIIFLITLLIGFLGIAATMVGLLPVLFVFLLAAAGKAMSTILFLIALSAFIIVLGIVITGACIATFQAMAWTILFERATEGMASAKIHRIEAWFRGLFTKK